MHRSGRHFLQLPGPTNVPDRVLRAMARPTMDHRGPDFARFVKDLLPRLRSVFKTDGHVFVYPSSGTGAWEAALTNTLSPGDRVLAFDQGFFATRWCEVAERFGLEVNVVPWDWRRGLSGERIFEVLSEDTEKRIRAVMVVHNETSTGVTTDLVRVRNAMDAVDHPALLLVDAVSSLAAIDLRHDDWRIDVTVSGSQKGLMCPPGLAFTAVSTRALAAAEGARTPRAYWDWDQMLRFNDRGFFPYTPATNLLYGLGEAVAMLQEEGLDRVFERHAWLAEATRIAVEAWGLEAFAIDPAESSNAGTTVLAPAGTDADALRRLILERFDMSLGTGLGRLEGRVFRIGHLGDFNALMLAGTLAGVEMGLAAAGVDFRPGGVTAALEYMSRTGAGSNS